MSQNTIAIDPDLLALLVCPVDHAALELKDSHLVCTECGRSYPIVDGIPNMVGGCLQRFGAYYMRLTKFSRFQLTAFDSQ